MLDDPMNTFVGYLEWKLPNNEARKRVVAEEDDVNEVAVTCCRSCPRIRCEISTNGKKGTKKMEAVPRFVFFVFCSFGTALAAAPADEYTVGLAILD